MNNLTFFLSFFLPEISSLAHFVSFVSLAALSFLVPVASLLLSGFALQPNGLLPTGRFMKTVSSKND